MRVSGFRVSSLVKLFLMPVMVALAVRSQAQTYTTLANFDGNDGTAPLYGSLVQAANGNFYGTTYNGGRNGYGVLFEVSPSGALTTIYDFCSQQNCADGASPWSSPILASDGNLYGTANLGGNPSGNSGTIFKMSLGGRIKTLYSFCYTPQRCLDGQNPTGLVQATNGVFYGTTGFGGQFNAGTLFAINSVGKFKVLYTFCSNHCADGQNPQSPPIQASNGKLYGTTYNGGSTGSGVVYEITPEGAYRVLYNFCSQIGCIDGGYPFSALVEDAAGNLYGTTVFGGNFGSGTVFKITPTNQFLILHSFDNTVGENPEAALIVANNGNLYGTTGSSSTGIGGNVFEITPDGVYSSLHAFCNSNSSCSAGYLPNGAMLQATDGNLYGTTNAGGTFGDGTVFSLSIGLVR
jgi:uncharacterized repeat protein (TIGR03803 family)